MVETQREYKYTIYDKYYPRLVQALPKTENVLFNYIGRYRDKNTSTLNSPYPDTKLIFDSIGEDTNIIFKACNINREELRKDIKSIELPDGVEDKTNLNESNALFVMMIRYYMSQKNPDKLYTVMMYYAYAIYSLRWWVSFKPYGPIKGIMHYTINNLSGKYELKKHGSIDKWLAHTLTVSFNTYKEKFQRFSDRDIDELISAFVTRISSAVKNIRDAYQTSYENKNTILESKDFIDDTTIEIEQQSFSSEVEKLSIEYTQNFFSTRPNSRRIGYAATVSNISLSELQVTIDLLFDNAQVNEMKEFFECIFTIFYSSVQFEDIRDVSIKGGKFLQIMESIFKKGNSKDPNILKAKKIIDEWLTKGSQTFRKTTRPATLIDYRRGVYMYFILFISGMA